MVIEVAPAELAPKRLRALSARQSFLELARREAAEVQVRREPRRRSRPSASWSSAYPRIGPSRKRSSAGAPRLAADRRLGHLLGEAERLEGRQPPLAELRRQRRQLARRVEHVTARLREPVAVKGREDRVRLARPRAIARDVVRVQPAMASAARCRPPRIARRRAVAAPTGERTHVAAEVDGLGPGLRCERRDLPLRPAVADDQARTRAFEGEVELARQSSRNWVRGPERGGRGGDGRRSRRRDDALVASSAARSAGWSRTRAGRVDARPTHRSACELRGTGAVSRLATRHDVVRRDVDDVLAQELDRRRGVLAEAAAHAARGAIRGAGAIGSAHAGQTSAPRASTCAPVSTSRRSSPTAEPPRAAQLDVGLAAVAGIGSELEGHIAE